MKAKSKELKNKILNNKTYEYNLAEIVFIQDGNQSRL